MSNKINRREALKLGALVAAPVIIPWRVLYAEAPSKMINVAMIGIGGQGGANLNGFLDAKDCKVIGVCDVDEGHLSGAANKVNGRYKNTDCRKSKDFRELLALKDLDAVAISTPDHWHSLPSIAAANAKKDIFCEKPLSHTLAEGIAVVAAVQKNERIWQTGSWQRSVADFRRAAMLVANGFIGKVTRVEVGLPSGHTDYGGSRNAPDGTPPPGVDYDFWIGPSTMLPFNPSRFHQNWRWNYNTGGGQLMDWIGHHCDIAHWGLSNPKYGCGPDDQIGPLELTAKMDFPPRDAVWNSATKFRIECKYPNNIDVVIAGGYGEIQGGAKWIGTNGWVSVNRGGSFFTSDKGWIKEIREREKAQKDLEVIFYDSPGHIQEFIDSCKSRKKTLTPATVAHRSQSPGHLGLIAARTGRKLIWDAAKQDFVGDAEATKMLSKEFRKPWQL